MQQLKIEHNMYNISVSHKWTTSNRQDLKKTRGANYSHQNNHHYHDEDIDSHNNYTGEIATLNDTIIMLKDHARSTKNSSHSDNSDINQRYKKYSKAVLESIPAFLRIATS